MKIKPFDDYVMLLNSSGEVFVSTSNNKRFLKRIDEAMIILTIEKDKLIVEPNAYSNMERSEIPLKNLKSGGTLEISFPQQVIVDL